MSVNLHDPLAMDTPDYNRVYLGFALPYCRHLPIGLHLLNIRALSPNSAPTGMRSYIGGSLGSLGSIDSSIITLS